MDKTVIALQPMQPGEVAKEWEKMAPALEGALEYLDGAVLPVDVLEMIGNGDVLALRILENEEQLGYLYLEKVIYPRKKYIRVFAMHGRELDVWFEAISRQTLKAAELLGFDGAITFVRPGLARALRRQGHSNQLMMVTANVGRRIAEHHIVN